MSEHTAGEPKKAPSIDKTLRELSQKYRGEDASEHVLAALNNDQRSALITESFRISRGAPEAHLLYAYYLGTLFNFSDVTEGLEILDACLYSLSDEERISIIQQAPKSHGNIYQEGAQRHRRLRGLPQDHDTLEIINEYELPIQLPIRAKDLSNSEKGFSFADVKRALKKIVEDETANINSSLFAISTTMGFFDGTDWYSDFPEHKKQEAINKGMRLLRPASFVDKSERPDS